MTRAAPPTSNEVEVWRHLAGSIGKVVRVNLAGVTHEDSLVQPHPGGNCLNWVLGHLLGVYNGLLPKLGQQPVMSEEVLKRYARGGAPIRDGSEALNFEELMSGWSDAVERVDAGLANLTPELLDRPVESPVGNPDETVRSLITTVMFHQAYHAGQTGVLRRITGKEGAIR